MTMTRTLLFATAAMTMIGAGAANAALSISAIQGGAPTGSVRDNLDALPLGSAGGVTATGITVSFNPTAAAVQGSVGGQYAAPFISGTNGAGFGNAPGQDTTTYVTSGSTGNGGYDRLVALLDISTRLSKTLELEPRHGIAVADKPTPGAAIAPSVGLVVCPTAGTGLARICLALPLEGDAEGGEDTSEVRFDSPVEAEETTP